MSMQQLNELRAQLVRAQRAENACVRKLNALLLATPTDRGAYVNLLARCHAARERSVAAYDAWARAVERFGEQTTVDGHPFLKARSPAEGSSE